MPNDDYRVPSRGMFGYEGEGYQGRSDREYVPRGYSDLEGGGTRGWNIGSGSDTAGTPMRPSYRGRGPKNYQRSDERIREEVCERLAVDHDIDASEIEVSVSSGVVTLGGSVQDRQMKRLAEDVSELVLGVRDVQNNLRVAR